MVVGEISSTVQEIFRTGQVRTRVGGLPLLASQLLLVSYSVLQSNASHALESDHAIPGNRVRKDLANLLEDYARLPLHA